MAEAHIGFIGLGRMGAPMVRRLLAAGYAVTAFDPDAAAMAQARTDGAAIAASPAEVAHAATVILMSLPTPDIVRGVALGADGIASGRAVERVVDLSTTGPEAATEIGDKLGRHGIAYIDAPVSGGVAGATKGKLTLMVSGPQASFDALAPVLGCLGTPHLVGESAGMGQTMKVINNVVSATAIAVSSEALSLGVKRGLDAERMLDIINRGTGRNGATMDKIPQHVLTGRFDFGFALGLSRKDTNLCLEEAEKAGVPMVVANAVRQLLTISQAEYGADADMMMMTRCIEEWAGVEIRGQSAESG